MKELAPRDLVARAIETEIREGRGILNPDHQIEHVWIDLRHLSDYIHQVQIPEVTGFFKRFMNLDPQKQLCPVRPSNHYQMGGIPTNAYGEVEKEPGLIVPRLYAIGECACASFHGFNRLGSNSLLELITMGKFVGQRISEFLNDMPAEVPPDAGERSMALFSGYLNGKQGDNLEAIREEMSRMMTDKVGVFRENRGLEETVSALLEFKQRSERISLECKSLKMNQELIQRWELDNLLTVAMVMAQGALQRRESRGGHFRIDFPERKDEFNHHTLVHMEEYGRVEFARREVDRSIYNARKTDYERFDIIERVY